MSSTTVFNFDDKNKKCFLSCKLAYYNNEAMKTGVMIKSSV